MEIQGSNQEIGKRVSTLRKQYNYTQTQLSNIIGISSKHLSEIERGVTGMSIDVQIQLSKVLNCSIDYLLKGDNYKSIEHMIPESIIKILKSGDGNEIQLVQEYMNLYEKIRSL